MPQAGAGGIRQALVPVFAFSRVVSEVCAAGLEGRAVVVAPAAVGVDVGDVVRASRVLCAGATAKAPKSTSNATTNTVPTTRTRRVVRRGAPGPSRMLASGAVARSILEIVSCRATIAHVHTDSARFVPPDRASARLPGVHFRVEHEFAAAPAAVAGVLCDPDFHCGLDLPDLSRPEVVEHTSEGNERVLKLRYQYVGQLDPIARRIDGGRKLTWLQELRLDLSTNRGTLTFAAEADAKRLNGSAVVALDAVDAAGTRRTIDGDLHVRVPLIGGNAEGRIVPGLVRRLDVEAAAAVVALESRA